MPRILLVSDYKTTSNAVYVTESKKGTTVLLAMRRDAQGVWSDWEEVGEVDCTNRVWPGGIQKAASEGRAALEEKAALKQRALEKALERAALEKAALEQKVASEQKAALEKKAALKEKQHPKKKQHQNKKPFDKTVSSVKDAKKMTLLKKS